MKTQGTGTSAADLIKGAGLAYKLGLGVIVVGVVMIVSSGLLGGVTFSAISALLRLLGAPEFREFLPMYEPDLPMYEPETGGHLLQFFGVILIACGICIVGVRFVAELLGLAGKPELTARLGWTDKLGLGVAAVGLLVGVSSGLSQVLLYVIFLQEYEPGTAMFALAIVMYAGGAILLGGLAVVILGRPGPRRVLSRVLIGWTDRVGWGKMGCGWINKLGLGLIVLALVGGALTPGFEGPTTIVTAAGIAILVVGVVPHILGGGRP